MDATDLAILREMSRDKVLWWGSLDPRLSAREIADRAGLPESTVRARVRGWERCGFLLGYETVPNPSLFGVGLAGGSLRAEDARAKPEVLKDLALVEGLILAQDHVGPWIGLAYVNESGAALSRRNRLVGRLPGVAAVEECVPFRVPPATVDPTPLDWRILRALRAAPRASLTSIAARVGVSVRTLTRHYGDLVVGGAVWSVPLLDFTRYEGAVVARVLVDLAAGADPAVTARRLRERIPDLIQMERSYEALPDHLRGSLDMVVQVPSAGALDDVEREILGIPGVEAAETVFPRRVHVYPAWFDERVAQRVMA